MVALAMLAISMASGHAADALSGSGVVVGDHGEVLTNAHVVNACAQISVRSSPADLAILLVALDQKERGPNDEHTHGGCHRILGRLAVLLSGCGSGSS